MKNKILIALLSLIFLACENGDIKNNEANILKMSFNFGEVEFHGNEGTVKAPENTELKTLIPTITVSEGAVVYPPSKAITDFTEPVDYTVTSEDMENVAYYKVSVQVPIVKFTVYDCTNRSAENLIPELAPNTLISIYQEVSGEKELIEELTADENGEAFLYGYRDHEYYFKANKNGAVNIINGYIVNGIFESQEDIDASPDQPQRSQVGDLKFLDVNSDFLVNEDDKYDYMGIWHMPDSGIKEIDVYIATPRY